MATSLAPARSLAPRAARIRLDAVVVEPLVDMKLVDNVDKARMWQSWLDKLRKVEQRPLLSSERMRNAEGRVELGPQEQGLVRVA